MQQILLDREIKSSGITVVELCEKTGIPTSTFYRKRSGCVPFDTRDINLICKVLGVTDPVKIKSIFLE